MNKELTDKAIELLRKHGKMKARELAKALGLSNARSISMALQYRHDVVLFDGTRWYLRPK